METNRMPLGYEEALRLIENDEFDKVTDIANLKGKLRALKRFGTQKVWMKRIRDAVKKWKQYQIEKSHTDSESDSNDADSDPNNADSDLNDLESDLESDLFESEIPIVKPIPDKPDADEIERRKQMVRAHAARTQMEKEYNKLRTSNYAPLPREHDMSLYTSTQPSTRHPSSFSDLTTDDWNDQNMTANITKCLSALHQRTQQLEAQLFY